MSIQRFQEHFLSAGILLGSWHCTWRFRKSENFHGVTGKAKISAESLFFYDKLIHSVTKFAPVPDSHLSACLTRSYRVPTTQQYSTPLSFHAFQINLFFCAPLARTYTQTHQFYSCLQVPEILKTAFTAFLAQYFV